MIANTTYPTTQADQTFAEVMHLSEADFALTETLINEYTAAMTLDVFQRMGVFTKANEAGCADGLFADLHILPVYDRLFDALLDLLVRHGYLTSTDAGLLTMPTVDSPATHAAIARYQHNGQTGLGTSAAGWAFIRDTVRLQAVCFEAMPDVLTGRRTYLEVMFPNGDMSLVGAVYKGTVQQYMNQQTARRVSELVARKLNLYGQVTLLEVGAGTGGTTAMILQELESFDPDKLTYWYTDISAGFTRFGKREFGTRYPYIRPKALDVSRSPAEQGFEPGCADIVICNNVLHATQSINQAVAHATELLRADGHLVVNDISKRLDFITVTFGLTHSWWSYADPECRIEHAPMLTANTWRTLLAKHGYHHVTVEGVPGMPEDQLHQSLIIATQQPQ